MIKAFSLAFGQLGDPRIRQVITISIACTALVYAVLCGLLAWLMFNSELLNGLPLWDSILDWAAVLLVPIAALLLFPAVISGVMGVFLERVVSAVEDRHYPGLPTPRPQPLWEVLVSSLRLIVLAVLLNLLVLPLFFFPIFGQIGFFAVNGFLISREYFELVALRRCDPAVVTALRKAHNGPLMMTGVLTTVLLTIPLVNVLAPVIGAAAMTHVVRRLPGAPLDNQPGRSAQ